jgi:hypothetical protein
MVLTHLSSDAYNRRISPRHSSSQTNCERKKHIRKKASYLKKYGDLTLIHRIAARGRTRALESVLSAEIPGRFRHGGAVPFHTHAVIFHTYECCITGINHDGVISVEKAEVQKDGR